MHDTNEIKIRTHKEVIIVTNVLTTILVAVDTDFFQLPLTDGRFIIDTVFWIAIFLVTMIKLTVSERGIKVYVLFVRVRFIDSKRIDRIEIIPWGNSIHAVFEFDKCPKFSDGSMVSLPNYLMVHLFRTIDYSIMEQQKDHVINLLESMFGDKEILNNTTKDK